ncbi:transcription-repair coupling factor [Dyadobacter fanqingshengii]|uniref:Transcription-repair-coupling factor n=1 Tax=Dyadobacter fanqingshengii TaxID=2906443 RepID=A0A9X1PC29_9BACT|nr:transcription-repair coupling factor [Dyadobacter fanqingshengii]MCF0042481.1 transcription-repair coupling factor [Dyadobacter fanqingshengii]MCF2506670.1 transcription-repair coupling factor [Dyadobacter fanqingshengii]USJ34996.1 transcription-repair coupling factor [Dyadobacter fanqingshengii]
MEVKDLLTLYKGDSYLDILSTQIASKDPEAAHVQIKGLVGSLDAVVAASIQDKKKSPAVYVLSDREEAAYFQNDLQNLIGKTEVLFYPTSYKRPYHYEEVDNANVLMRGEILNKLSASKSVPTQIVTYPEALFEKVINKRSLKANTFSVKVGEKLDPSFLTEFLTSYGFEITDFVFEAGQFSVRGGILDVFSFANEHPFRIELFGDEVESIRSFDPDTQLSLETAKQINIVPDIQQKLSHETRESFLNFFAPETVLWFKDAELTLEIIENCFEKAEKALQEVTGGGIQIVSNPQDLYETRRGFLNQVKKFKTVEFGKKGYFKTESKLPYSSKPQPSFNKDFKRLLDDLSENQSKGYVNIIVAEQPKQLDRLERIFEDLDPFVKFRPMHISLREGFVDDNLKIVCYTDHQIFARFHKYRLKEKFSKSKAITLKELKSLHPGDFVTHVDYGIGRFAGMERKDVNGKEQEAIRLIYRDNDLLYVSVHNLHKIAKYTGKEGTPPAMSKLGSGEWEAKKSKVKKQLKDIAHELIALYAKRRQAPGFPFSPDNYMQAELESSFIYEDTPDQATATANVKEDMEKAHPMDRLVCGDVGFGKTEIAIRAAFKSVCDSKQVAVLVPTTILAMQHFKTFSERLADFPAKVGYINRFKSTKEIKETLKQAEEGKIDILIGTHRILNKDVKFKDLGLLIVDEEQKFGVKAKDRLKEMRVNVDVLTLTATPIPRTLHFSLMGARDLSVIATPPPNRQPVTTEVHTFSEEFIRDAISFEVQRGGQVFFVHNRVNDIESIANIILRLVPDVRIGVAHGQMDGDKLEKVMVSFIEGDYDVLVSTNIIESGIDIANANTIIINSAHMFGLSDLHQMRGRVGRSNRKAFCYLLTPSVSTLASDSRKRLQTLEEFSELGDGFKVAMRDLDIRGAGNLLGAEQSGFVNDLGYELYHKMLDEAVQELKNNEFKDLFSNALGLPSKLVPDCQIETDFATLIPDDYVKNISERLSLYTRLDNISTEDELAKFEKEILDRFGPIPAEVEDLLKMVRLRWEAELLHFEKLTLKSNTLKGYFVTSQNDEFFQSPKFGMVIDYIKQHPRKIALKDQKGKLMLICEDIKSIEQARKVLMEMTGSI